MAARRSPALSTGAEYLLGTAHDDGSWTFAVGRERHGAFGGAFGGVVSAVAVVAARSAAPGRVPAALDVHYLRGLPAGDARVVPTVVRAGRTLSVVAVDVYDGDGKLATRATATLVAPEALEPLDHPGSAGPVPTSSPWEDGTPWRNPPGVEVPLIATFQPRAVGRSDAHGVATALRVPWDEPGAAAEAACLAADVCVGPPVAGAGGDRWIPHPNPDLSLRFASRHVGAEVVGWGRLERIEAGVATVRVEVRSDGNLLAAGVSTSLLLARRGAQ